MTESDKWDIRFLKLAALVAAWSKDPRKKVGAVIVNSKHCVVGVGFNGIPRNIDDLNYQSVSTEQHLLMTVHAEVNAILNSAVTERATIYCTSPPCAGCAGIIIQSGIIRVVSPPPTIDSDWINSWKIANDMMMEAGVRVNEMVAA